MKVSKIKYSKVSNPKSNSQYENEGCSSLFIGKQPRNLIKYQIKNCQDNFHTDNEKKVFLIADQFSSIFDLAYNSYSALQAEINEGLKIFYIREYFNPSF